MKPHIILLRGAILRLHDMSAPLISNINIEPHYGYKHDGDIKFIALLWYFFIQILFEVGADDEGVIF